MSEAIRSARRTVPARIADLGFSVELPADWIAHELPEQPLDFDNPTFLVPLAILTAPQAALVFTVAARPAYGDGAVHDWAWYLLRENGLQPAAIGAEAAASLPAIVGEAAQESELGPLQIRFAFAEDGGRLLNLSLTAPKLFSDLATKIWFAALASFRLESPRGATVALMPPVEAVSTAPPAPDDEDAAPPQAPEPARKVNAKRQRKAQRKAAARSPGSGSMAGAERLNRAMALEADGQLDAAERQLGRDNPDPGTAYQLAEMYRGRMNRLLASGDRDAAREAFQRADQWIHQHAAQATSGGEGVALSAERDAFLEYLVRDFGGEAD